jgi:hypothetical protein
MTFGGSWRTRTCACALLLAIGVMGGCGDDGDSAAKEERRYHAVGESPDRFAERFAKLLETSTTKADCAQLEQINSRSYTRFGCPTDKAMRDSMKSFEVVGSRIYGTGAVVDYKSGKSSDGAAIVMFIAPDRNWGIGRFGISTPPSTKTSDDETREGFDAAVDKYLTAIRERDCDAYYEMIFKNGDTKAKVCRAAFPATSDLAKRLEANPSAKPRYQGGNSRYGFYALETAKPEPERSTISVLQAGTSSAPSYVVLDVAPTLTTAEERAAVQALKEQLKKGPQGGMGPSEDAKPSEPAVKP